MKKTILITGASGLIGTNLVDELLNNGYSVIGLSKTYPLKTIHTTPFESENFIPLTGDITDKNLVEEIFEKYCPHVIIHLAAQTIVDIAVSFPYDTLDINIRGTLNILNAALKIRGLEKIIVASSDKAYGDNENLPYKENYELNAISPYDLSKKISEELAMSYYKIYQLPIIITRCGNVYGKYDMNLSRIVPGTILSALNNNEVVLRSDGQQQRCYIYAKDVCVAYRKMIESHDTSIIGEAFNIGDDKPVQVVDLVKIICKAAKPSQQTKIKIMNTSRFEIKNQYLDSTKAQEMLDWKTDTSLTKGIALTVDWYKENLKQLNIILKPQT